ncbi:helix-turn-helix domain-containing protein [Aquirufa sp.]|jgi:transcriptional regulator with XRE-family HTH domain|uniref:helix-turn-helix domain-containing protein n=1 Tax=Aquirufa sp. TaxID=2676249 RepID=UPI0037C0B39D
MMSKLLINLKNLREERRISQEAVAFNLKITQSTYAKLESGKTKLSVERLLAIATYFQVDVRDLL